MSYATGTAVPVEKSKAELDRLLSRAGATQRLMGDDEVAGFAFVVFGLAGRRMRLRIPLPLIEKFKTGTKMKSRGGHHPPAPVHFTRSPEQQREAHEQACRERWRVFVLLVKAKLEAIDLGLSSIEKEFLGDIYLPDGRTVHEALIEPIQQAYETGTMPPLLGPGGGT